MYYFFVSTGAFWLVASKQTSPYEQKVNCLMSLLTPQSCCETPETLLYNRYYTCKHQCGSLDVVLCSPRPSDTF